MLQKLRQIKQFQSLVHIGTYLTGNLIKAALPFITLPFLTAYLVPEEYGVWSLYLAIMSLLLPLTACGMPMTLGRNFHIVDKQDHAKMVFAATINIAVLCLLFFIAIALYGYFKHQIFSIPIEWVLIMPFLCFIQNFQYLNKIIIRHQHKAFLFSALDVANGAAIRFIGLAAVILINASWISLLQVHIGVQVVFALIALYLLLSNHQIKFQWDGAKAKSMMAMGWPLIPHAIGGIIMNLSDRLILEQMTTVEAVGIYSLGANFGIAVQLFCTAVNNKWGPWMYERLKNQTEADKIKIVRYTYLYFLATAALTLGLAVFAMVYTYLFIDASYHDAIPVIAWVAAGSGIYGMSYVITHYIIILGKTTLLPKITGFAALLNIGLTVWLVQENGYIGAAQATFIAYLSFFIIMWWQNNKHYPMPWLRALKRV